ncbi:MAG: hypothetical protein GTO03_03300, partial [Planctomycetales bacterium]|nr:hypothetical protein [Planctomycetales bacterium]
AVTAQVYQPGLVSADTQGAPRQHGETITVTNAASTDGGQRASVVVDDFAVSGHGWSVTGLQAGVTE